MPDQIIYPSEIIVAKKRKQSSLDPRLAPWIRLFARLFDYNLVYLGLQVAKHFVPSVPFYIFYYFPLAPLLFIPLETIFIRCFKTTPGKALLNIKVSSGRYRVSLEKSWKRACLVYFFGMAFGIRWLAIFTMSQAYSRLVYMGMTSWDFQEKVNVTQKPPFSERLLFVLFVLLFSYYYF